MAAEMVESLSNAILKAYPFDKEGTVVLDYACGTGSISRRLAPHCKTLIGADISQGMVDQFNKGLQDDGTLSEKMRAVRAELKGEETELEGMKFDLVLCTLAYHHIADIMATTRILAFFLKPGGTLLVIDTPALDMSAVPTDFVPTIAHKGGISEAAIKDAYDAAALRDFRCVAFENPHYSPDLPLPKSLFVATGVKH